MQVYAEQGPLERGNLLDLAIWEHLWRAAEAANYLWHTQEVNGEEVVALMQLASLLLRWCALPAGAVVAAAAACHHDPAALASYSC